MSDLADRPNPSAWAELLDLALPIVDAAILDGSGPDAEYSRWTLGGGTAIALRIAHRASDDIDLFVTNADLRLFTPTRNPHSAALGAVMEFPGNDLKFRLPEGEIDFLPGPLLTEPGFTVERFRGRTLALQTSEEVIIKKIRYRASSFKARDIFDLAAVAECSKTLADNMVDETADRLPTLLTAIRRHDAQSFASANIRSMPGYERLLTTALQDAERLVVDLIGGPGGLGEDRARATTPRRKEPSQGHDLQATGQGSGDQEAIRARLPVARGEVDAAIANWGQSRDDKALPTKDPLTLRS